jgi:hypothetical protein
MPFLTVAEFEKKLRTEPLEQIVTTEIFGGDAFIFQGMPAGYNQLRAYLSGRVGCAPDDIVLVGSSRVGFSP